MGFFNTKKQKVNLEEFCRLYYDDVILNPKDATNTEYPETFKKQITELLPEFESVSLEKIRGELRNLTFELFALLWVHNFGIESAIKQSIFTKSYLHEKRKDDIWEGMEHYNKSVSHSILIQTGNSKDNIIKKRVDLFDRHENTYKDNEDAKYALARAINRAFSEKAYKIGCTNYFLMLALCHKFGLGSGKEYLGPNKKAQSGFVSAIAGMYSGMSKYFDNIEIES